MIELEVGLGRDSIFDGADFRFDHICNEYLIARQCESR